MPRAVKINDQSRNMILIEADVTIPDVPLLDDNYVVDFPEKNLMIELSPEEFRKHYAFLAYPEPTDGQWHEVAHLEDDGILIHTPTEHAV